ncbi:hypothetical protein GB931_10870 [Modestobacter sp. I12A-02628]|uniref:Putative zinc-finger domain-containing protein n=1 Tax=Goekera deserti TaxID=2497753 RepID=A0A7K3WBY5_9ACTN|nr:zf-HC2 domain-containing protein [Goekera deserti]MPQ98409.1 hypothetical protein [Goekera deserti]NDI48236.1 hypothetical protein [Goekera deserti]NEL53985.1 hypothetical protein [Goekera deserti]
MSCAPFREALSARLDGEDPGLPVAELDAHLAHCDGCAPWAERAALVTRRARVAPVTVTPDLTHAVLSALPARLPAARQGSGRLADRVLRAALVLLAVAQGVLAWPSLVHGVDDMSAPAHVAHETGAWNAALAVAFLAVAAAPRLAAGALPLLGSFVAVLTVVTVRDLAAGRVDADRALTHVLLLTGLLLVGLVAWRGRSRGVDRPALVRRRAAA